MPSIYASAPLMPSAISLHDAAPEALEHTIISPSGLCFNMRTASFADQMLCVCPQWIASMQVLRYDAHTHTYCVLFMDSSGQTEQIENIAVGALQEYLASLDALAYVVTRMKQEQISHARCQRQRPSKQQSIEFCACLFFLCTLLWIIIRNA